jgi:hypothetical protein
MLTTRPPKPHSKHITPKKKIFTKLHGVTSQKAVTFDKLFWITDTKLTHRDLRTGNNKYLLTMIGINDDYSEHDDDNDCDVDDNDHNKIII